ncbi:MAG: MIP/aquaporin family protein [Acidobacteriota bacterium]
MSNKLIQEVSAEFIGTMLILLFGAGVVAMVQLFGGGAPGEVVNGGYTNITLGWGVAVALGVAISARISGGHLNPAVTIASALLRGFPWSKVGPYVAAQMAGAFVGAGVVFLNYKPAFLKVDPMLEKTAGVFATFPAFPEMPLAGFMDQVIGTALLLFVVSALTDENTLGAPAWMTPLLVGLVVVAIGMSFGALHGYAINPARDLGPRLMTVVAGFRNNGLTDGSGVWLIPVVAPVLGAIVGAAAYDFTIRRANHEQE